MIPTNLVLRLLIPASLVAALPASLPAQQYGGSQMSASSDTLPANFRGRITYQGTHEAVLERGSRRGSRQYGGSLTIELTFDGNAVSGRFSGTGGINNGTMSGTRNGSRCRLFEERAGDIVEGECTRTRFSAVARSQGSRNSMAAAFEARATQLADARVEEEQRRIAAAEAAERARAAAAAYDALPSAGPALTRRLDGYVQTDARGWAYHRYDAGSLTNVKIIDGSVRSGNFVMQGYYTFNGGSRGWVMGKMAGGKLECIQFWNSVIGCRGLRTPEQGQAMRDAAMGAVVGALTDSSSRQPVRTCRSGYGTGTPGTEQPC